MSHLKFAGPSALIMLLFINVQSFKTRLPIASIAWFYQKNPASPPEIVLYSNCVYKMGCSALKPVYRHLRQALTGCQPNK